MCVWVHVLEHESRSTAIRLEDSTSPPLPLSSSCSPLSGGTRGLALIMAKGLTVTLTQDVVIASPGQGWTGHASPFPLPHPETMRAIADHLLPLPSQQSRARGQITLTVCVCVCVCVYVCVRCFFQPSPHLLYCHFTVLPAGPPRWHIYLSGKWGTAAAGHVKTFTNSIKNITVGKKSWGRK